MKILRTLFGEIVTIDAKDREEVKKLEQVVAELERQLKEFDDDYEQLCRLLHCTRRVLDAVQDESVELRLERNELRQTLSRERRHLEFVKDLIRNIID